ncbi:secreted nuclease [Tritrichomonas foetus]|uniref:Secreted nuclease n=1 Tax=Tritrichomonas foetus TaxID=1144522 RepID=A0A1J4JNA3_9EUKA|nr:secreted nuclease [Tritrichomonas foetus]|eukprot:OHT00555.1 secreted nuclease [Tritrichomonas foetus]
MFFSLLILPCLSAHIKLRPRIGETLKEQLKRLYGDHIVVNYQASRRKMYGITDCENNAIRLIYGNSFYEWTCGNQSIPNPNHVNAEHVVPQSTFKEKTPMVSDLHHLISSPSKVNNARSNFPFGEFPYSEAFRWCTNNECTATAPDKSLYEEYSVLKKNTMFMPRVSDRGQVARAIFYFYTIYPDYNITDVGDVETFKKWNNLYPPQAHEIARNNAINRTQGNRNPYIDDPSLVDQVW